MLEDNDLLISSTVDKNKWWFEKTYNQLIERGKSRGLDKSKLEGYYEKHHIVPKCVGGEDNDDNYVLLTYREHIIAHILLIRIYQNNKDLVRAAAFMLEVDRLDEFGNKITIKLKNTKLAESIKLESLKFNRGIYSPSYGRKLTEEHKKAISEANKHPKSIETRRKMSESQKGTKQSLETREKESIAHKGLHIHTKEHKDFLSNKWKINNPRKNMDMTGSNNPSSKRVIDPNGNIHESLKRCAKENNIPYDKLRDWVKNDSSKGFKLI